MFEGLKVSATWIDQEDWAGTRADKWRVTISRNGARMQVPFSQGSGFGGNPPTAGDVMESLVSDASRGEQDFEEFCSELGFDEDSRKAYESWKSCQSIHERLPKVLTMEEIVSITIGDVFVMEALKAITTKNN